MRSVVTGTMVRGVLLSVVCGAALVSAQPPLTITDPYVEQIQRLGPPVPPASVPDSPRSNPNGTTVPTGVTATPGRGQAAVFDPPPPVVQLQLRTPANLSVGKPVPYRMVVTNTSAAKALRVKVRMPWPDGAAALTKCDPKPEGVKDIPPQGVGPAKGPDQKPLDLVWDVGDLQGRESKTYDLTFNPVPDAKKVSATAYVSFEYGAKVETTIDKPKIQVKRTATPEVAVGELVTVRVEVTNPGTVPIPQVRLVEQAPVEAEFRGDEKAEQTNVPGQREWKLGTLSPGQTVFVQYQLLARKPSTGKGMLTSSQLAGDAPLDVTAAHSYTKVLQPALHLHFSGTPAAPPKAPALYKAVVRNVGTLPLGDVRLSVDVPDELTVTKRTNGAKVERGRLTWVIPKLPAGEAHEFSIECVPEAGVAGKKLLKAMLTEGRGVVEKQTAEAGTEFVGRADLTWKPKFDNAWVRVGRQGVLTVKVENQGAETDNGVRLRVKLPPEVKYVGNNGATPATFENAEVLFPVQKLAPGKTTEFVITYEGKSPGPGRFYLVLEGESLGNKPLTKEQEVLVERQ